MPFNEWAVADRRLCWLQDTPEQMVWDKWQINYRDVRILDAENRLVSVFNLTEFDLAHDSNRLALKQLFLAAAKFVDADKDKLLDAWEMLYFGELSLGSHEDTDGDGVTNFSEYAFGTNPKERTSFDWLKPELLATSQGRILSVKFRRRAGNAITYFLETSSDLKNWAASSTEVGPQRVNVVFDGTGSADSSCALKKSTDAKPAAYVRVKAIPK